ncbi:MAG: hypothetical protein NT069_27640 [Planctomycetota bacterium]|nr:hypothetical protein [Planctomycetota bacterium]
MILRSVGAVVAGLVVTAAIVVGVEIFSAIFHPFPPGVDPSDLEVCKAQVARYPTWLLACAAAGWCVSSLAGSWLATRLGTARHPAHGATVWIALQAMAAANMAMLPYAMWFPIVIEVGLPLAAFFGIRKGRMTEFAQRAAHSESAGYNS